MIWTPIDNCKLANEIARVTAIVVKSYVTSSLYCYNLYCCIHVYWLKFQFFLKLYIVHSGCLLKTAIWKCNFDTCIKMSHNLGQS